MKPLNPLEMASALELPVWWLTKPEGDQRRAAAALLREMAVEIDRLRAATPEPGQQDTCKSTQKRLAVQRDAPTPVIYFDNAGNLISRVSQEQVEAVLSDALDRIRGVSSAPRRSASQ